MTVLEWRPPPPRSNLVLDAETVMELQRHAGEWGLVRVYRHHAPPGRVKRAPGVELRCRYRSVGGRRYTELYARWVGPR